MADIIPASLIKNAVIGCKIAVCILVAQLKTKACHILIFGQMRGAYLGGSILTFFLGYCILFFKSGFLLSAYPFSAALVLAGFDMQEYNGATEAPSIPLSLLGMGAVIALTAVLLLMSRPSNKGAQVKPKKAKGRGRRQAGRRTR